MPRCSSTAQRTASTALPNSDHRRDQLVEMAAQVAQRALLVGAHQAAVARHIGEQDGGEAAVAAGVGASHLDIVT
jgi:hypothetical protein